METIVKFVSGDKLQGDTCDLCAQKSEVVLSVVKKAGQDLYVLKSYCLCSVHIEVITQVLTGEHIVEQINYEKATKRSFNLRG